MTHDELLALIDRCEDFAAMNGGTSGTGTALRAVVELHKPWTATEEDRYWGGSRNELGEQRCPACAMPSAYPCPTIQKIMDELK